MNFVGQMRKYAYGFMCICAWVMVAFHEYTTATLPLTGFMQTAVHLCLAIFVIGLGLFAANKSEKITVSDIVILIMLAFTLLFNLRILATGGMISAKLTANIATSDMVFALFALVGVLLATKFSIGMAMVYVALVFLAYAFFGPYMPGLLYHNGIQLKRLLSAVYFTNEGIYGSPLRISASEIFPLMIYGGIMVGLGGGDLLMGIAQRALGKYRGGIAKIAVLSSALFGMLSGAGPANAATTGTFTIPMMKKNGYTAPFAGAVEATASIGGQIMPPIMGASAFIMAEYLGVSYGELILCAAPAAILYYVAIFISVDVEAQKRKLVGLKPEEMPIIAPLMKDYWHLLISVFVLIYLLTFRGYGPGASGFWATVTIAVTETINCIVRKKRINFKEFGIYLVDCVKNASSIAVSCACAGIILCVVDRSGLAVKMTSLMITISGGHVLGMLIMSAIASLIMGMALPTVACFIVVATMVAPSLIQAGVDPYAAYFFAFYFGMVSNITPPVALTAFVAAGIAKASPIKTACEATKIGMAAYLLPFLFVWQPGLLLQGTTTEILYHIAYSTFIIFTAAVVFGGFWNGTRVPMFLRGIMLLCAIVIFSPFQKYNLLCCVIITACFAWHYIQAKKAKSLQPGV